MNLETKPLNAVILYKYLLWFALIVGLTACKSSAPLDDLLEEISGQSAPANEVETVVVSTADIESPEEGAIAQYDVEAGEFNLYPREINGWDESGWSIITPSEDSRLIYVSSSLGDDDTAEFYLPRDIDQIKNPGLIKPFKTVNAALKNARRGYADWILLRKDDEWQVNERAELPGGRSPDERTVLTSYGQGGDRPVITKSKGKEILRIWSNQSYLAITGISFYAEERDPAAPKFAGWGNVPDLTGILIYGPKGTRSGTILLENNNFNFLSKAINSSGKAEHVDIVIRRNIIRNSYSEQNHSQGIYASHTSALLEENIFDHNGWLKPQNGSGNDKAEGQATMFNHNTYFSESLNSIFRRNIFLRPSSIHNKWAANSSSEKGTDSIESKNILIEDNLYVGGEIGISAGGNTDFNTGYRWENISIVDNVMLAVGRDRPTSRNLGWYIESSDWKGGKICGNYLLHNDNTAVTNLKGIEVNGHSSDVRVTGNLVHGIINKDTGANNGAIRLDAYAKSAITIKNNRIQLSKSKMRILVTASASEIVLSDNTYFSSADDGLWFRSDDQDFNLSSWQLLADDFGSVELEEPFDVPKRDFESYLASIGLEQSLDHFMQAVISQPERNWDRKFAAETITAYIKRGYGDTKCSDYGE